MKLTRAGTAAVDSSASPRPESADRVRALADVCVKCGLCLPHCPTYRLSGVEGESPRGRIALVQGLVEGRLPPTGNTAEHLESCTGCLSCETVCPARVRYGELIDRGRVELRRQGYRSSWWSRCLALLSRRPRLMRRMIGLLGQSRRLGLGRIASALGLSEAAPLGRLIHRLPARIPGGGRLAGTSGRDRTADSVMLFTGCLGPSLDRRTLVDALAALEASGCAVEVPERQACCGALDLHDGRPDVAAGFAEANCRAFGAGSTPVVTLASGCSATLHQYERLVPDDGALLARRLRDVLGIIDERWEHLERRLARLDLRIAVFEPCSARNTAEERVPVAEILGRITGVEVVDVDPGYGCCGAAGHHFVTRAGQADALLAPILQTIEDLEPDIVAVANVGCALHLAGALIGGGRGPEVLHPVSVVARSLAGTR